MSLCNTRRRFHRGTVAWYLLGLGVVQLGLSALLAWVVPGLRDPVFDAQRARLAARRAEAPDRPLLLALGSSRTLMGLDAGLATRLDGSWLVFNGADLGAGPMLEQVFLRRLCAAGVRPDLVWVEVVPLQLATSVVVPSEEHALDPGRLTWAEMTSASAYYRFPATAYARWLKARGLPAVSRQRELHDALRIDLPRWGLARAGEVDGYGYLCNGAPVLASRIAGIQADVRRFGQRLADAHLAAGPVRAVRDLVGTCRRERLPFVLVVMPEASAFRALPGPAFGAELEGLLAELQRDGALDLIDARAWVPDDGFGDAHHLHRDGAQAFTTRFAQEVLPRMRRDLPSRPAQQAGPGTAHAAAQQPPDAGESIKGLGGLCAQRRAFILGR